MSDAPAARGPLASQYLSDASAIRRALVTLRDHCLPVKVQFPSTDDEFAARILDVTAAHLLLEDVKPREGLQRLRDGEPFSLTARLEGVYARADGLAVHEVGDDYGVPYCIVALPAELLFQQRRHSERFAVPPRLAPEGARVSLKRRGRTLTGTIADLSAGGCLALLDAVSDPEVATGELIERCEVEIPGQLVFTARIVVRHQHYNKSTSQLECGCEFDRMRLTDRRRLERFIHALAKAVDPLPPAPASAPSRRSHRDPTASRAPQP
jgi:c-di-GMP-binding flagellar brake protein YcgR